ncbi:phage baseplate assembly protein, partial [Chromobacterium vaccinii]|uniref:phage baseplate assembly protein n=1 Tax=Chromobacterium vaccinii TaxID=1108595 RepID=UPI003C7101EA
MDDLTLVTNGRRISGWTSVSVVRGIERFPSGFQIGMTELYPGQFGDVLLRPGDPAQVLLGGDVVVTGYMDDFSPALSASAHSISASGRGKCQDLVDCSHFYQGCQMTNITPLAMAIQLATPYGIDVVSDVGAGKVVPVWQLPWGETPYNILEPVARNSQMLVYENPDGSLRLSQAMRASAGVRYPVVAEGVNIESITTRWSMAQRFSQYIGRSMPMDVMSDAGTSPDVVAVVNDPGVPRLRVRSIIAETGDTSDYETTKA